MVNTRGNRLESSFAREPLPICFCNLDRLQHALAARGLDGIVAISPHNVFYLSGFNGIAHKSDEPRPYAVILSRHSPEHPIVVIADYYLATFLSQPTWVEDVLQELFRKLLQVNLEERFKNAIQYLEEVNIN